MADLALIRYPLGISAPDTLELSGKHPWANDPEAPTKMRRTSLIIDWLDARGDIVFHFNPRPDEGAVVLNSHLDGTWGERVVVRPYPLPLEADVPLLIRFEILEDRFCVFADGRHLVDFTHRRAPGEIKEVRANTFLWRLESGRRAITPLTDSRPRPRDASWTWAIAEDNPRRRRQLRSFRFFAVLATWMEEDVVAATVANCLRQGCERVYLVDNESADRTVEQAVGAGALVARTFATERYDEAERIRQMQAVVDEVSAAEGDEHIWWLFVDADEFHHGPGGLTLREYLAKLDRRFRIVGARLFNHLPGEEPGYVEGRHPLDFQPLCYEVPRPHCQLGHSNHPLQRWDRAGPPMVCEDGAHYARCDEMLREPTQAVFFHHFPYREEAATRRRLERLFGAADADRVEQNPDGYSMRLRLRSVDAVYRGRWGEVLHFPPCVPGYVPELRPWEEWVDASDRRVARWYEQKPAFRRLRGLRRPS